MRYKLYMVIGGESSGTRLVTNLLIEGGCFGDSSHSQRMDDYMKARFDVAERDIKEILKNQPIVFRRSFPHGNAWPVLKDLISPFVGFNLVGAADILFLVTVRNWFCAAKSAVRIGHGEVKSEGGHLSRFKLAYCNIFKQLEADFFNYYMVSYDELVARPYFSLQQLYKVASLKVDPSRMQGIATSIRDENNKWYFGG